MPRAPDDVMRTADGVPLKISLQRALVRSRIRALLLVVPLLAFIAVAFVLPIGDMLFRSVDNRIVESILPRTAVAIQDWNPNGTELPDEAVFEALTLDIKAGVTARTLGRVARRLNYEKPGMTSLFRKTGRRTKRVAGPPYKERILEIDGRWRDLNTWRLIRREAGALTSGYFLASVDLKTDDRGEVVWQSEERRIYLILFFRTLWMSALITVLCLLLGYPVAYLLATLPLRTSNLLMILVLLPFWTSLLVRTTSWIALLQTEGVLNDVLVFTGLISDDGRLQLIHNQFGTFVAMVHILLPFMILPLYSVMKTIPPSLMRAARSLGATPFTAFVRVYMPNTVSGVGAGSIMVFILSIGYYITPALVGGRTGTFISNFIAVHVSETLNWGLAAALGSLLLALVLALYLLYDRLVGIDNMKLG
ncbi:MAG: ABC transporter permease [Rhodospirillaceae bacterium]|nr:ABC transporter permease [Rhodospirillaceae bacterium]MYJ70214.1 ABC transporter permease [Rhodospirillaceae bacterium]